MNKPLEVDKKHYNKYDIVMADPPFLNSETIKKVSETMKLISKKDSLKIIITGLQLEDIIIKEFPELKLRDFKIEHDKQRLKNPFGLFCAVDLEKD